MRKLLFYIVLLFIFSCGEESIVFVLDKPEQVFLSHNNNGQIDSEIPLKAIENFERVRFIINGLYGNTDITELNTNNSIQISDLPQQILNRAGTYTISASRNGIILDKCKLLIKAGQITGTSTTFSGPKTTSYNDKEGSMITGYFQDIHNNMVDTTLVLQYHIQGEGSKATESVPTDHTYYFTHVIDSKNDSKQLVGIETDDQYSSEILVKGNSGCPVEANMYLKHLYKVADGRQIFEVLVDQILDADNHEVADGSFVELTFRSEESQSNYFGEIVNGRATFIIQNPKIAGTYIIRIHACDKKIAQSNRIKFSPLVDDIPYEIGQQLITIGPLLSELYQTIPDGTEIILNMILDDKNIEIIQLSKSGFVSFLRKDLGDLSQTKDMYISLNGIERKINIDQNLSR